MSLTGPSTPTEHSPAERPSAGPGAGSDPGSNLDDASAARLPAARLRIGLLLCDHLDLDVAAQVGDYPDLFSARFAPLGVDLVVHDLTVGEFPTDLDALDGWIVSGSRRSTYEDEDWIHDLEDLVRRLVEQRRKLIGICFGHQMVAQALGGVVERAEVGWGVGVKSFDLTASAPWIDRDHTPSGRFSLLTSHRDQVTRLPEGAEVLATAGYCPVGAYRIDDHVFCVQGHPEWIPELSRILMGSRRIGIGGPVADTALVTLDAPIDAPLVVEWMADFFRY